MDRMLAYVSNFLYIVAIFSLFTIALILMGHSMWEVYVELTMQEAAVKNMLHAIGATIVAIALIDVAKYLAEEELGRDRELRSPEEARKTLTKIITILIIAIGLEGLVYIFKAGMTELSELVYPAMLVLTSVIALVALGFYQKMSIKTEMQETQKRQGGTS